MMKLTLDEAVCTKHRLYYGRKSVQNCFIKFVPYVKPSNLVLVEEMKL